MLVIKPTKKPVRIPSCFVSSSTEHAILASQFSLGSLWTRFLTFFSWHIFLSDFLHPPTTLSGADYESIQSLFTWTFTSQPFTLLLLSSLLQLKNFTEIVLSYSSRCSSALKITVHEVFEPVWFYVQCSLEANWTSQTRGEILVYEEIFLYTSRMPGLTNPRYLLLLHDYYPVGFPIKAIRGQDDRPNPSLFH